LTLVALAAILDVEEMKLILNLTKPLQNFSHKESWMSHDVLQHVCTGTA
jgi:hypothetical protein